LRYPSIIFRTGFLLKQEKSMISGGELILSEEFFNFSRLHIAQAGGSVSFKAFRNY